MLHSLDRWAYLGLLREVAVEQVVSFVEAEVEGARLDHVRVTLLTGVSAS